MLKEHLDIFRALKEKSNLTNQQISDKSGLSLSTINRFFRGDIENPSFDEVNRIIAAMGFSISSLVDTEVYSITRYNIDELLIPYADKLSAPIKHELDLALNNIEHLKDTLAFRKKIYTVSLLVNLVLIAFICIFLILI